MSDLTAPPAGYDHLSACVLIERDGRFAAVLSTKHGGRPELPGGKAKRGETMAGCARREVREELGIEVSDLVPIMQMDVEVRSRGEKHLCTIFAGRIDAAAQLSASTEGDPAWVSEEDLLNEGTYREHVAFPLVAYHRHRAAEAKRERIEFQRAAVAALGAAKGLADDLYEFADGRLDVEVATVDSDYARSLRGEQKTRATFTRLLLPDPEQP